MFLKNVLRKITTIIFIRLRSPIPENEETSVIVINNVPPEGVEVEKGEKSCDKIYERPLNTPW